MTKLQSAVRSYEIEIDGKERDYRMCLNYQALTKLCDIWGIKVENVDSVLNKLSVDKIPDVIFAAMCGYDDRAKEADAKAFCKAVSVPDLSRVCSELISSSSPPSEGGKTGPRHQRKP